MIRTQEFKRALDLLVWKWIKWEKLVFKSSKSW